MTKAKAPADRVEYATLNVRRPFAWSIAAFYDAFAEFDRSTARDRRLVVELYDPRTGKLVAGVYRNPAAPMDRDRQPSRMMTDPARPAAGSKWTR